MTRCPSCGANLYYSGEQHDCTPEPCTADPQEATNTHNKLRNLAQAQDATVRRAWNDYEGA